MAEDTKGEQINLRVSSEWLKALDAWRGSQVAQPTRPQAIRALAELGLKAAKSPKEKR